jgi:hypothetical protein
VAANITAQHLRRVVWRNGRTDIQPTICITTSINFRDSPDRCIAVTAVRKAAKLYEKLSPEAVWFNYNGTYADDVLSGDDNPEKLKSICHGLDAIVKKGGFKLKGNMMSGDPTDGPDDLKKKLVQT